MQETRQRILEIIKARGQATVDELGRELGLTPVTIRHHLEILRSEGLIAPPQSRRKKGPGRPQYVYRLGEEAEEFFPKNYHRLAEALLTELEARLPTEEMEELVEGTAERMAALVELPEGSDLSTRLEAALEFLNGLGYLASAETGDDGRYWLHIANCPYDRVARRHPQPCQIDERMISLLLGVDLERVEKIIAGGDRCTYLFPSGDPPS
ncbi:MAG TPA: ArsR family transcriptional regulator [Anaerolineales bacterium]|nr:ArsR family transcriptional regulator [Anaerolineae bacterium]HIQ02602.1 ArsR family transcriptional regulator [Anaerolineales bacterium]